MTDESAKDVVVFNGDADGLCALQQLRLSEGTRPMLVTGVKRDIDIVARVVAGAGSEVTVLDLSYDRNRRAVERLLNAGSRVRYFDHHFAGSVPQHPRLDTHIDTSEHTCTSTLVNRYLNGRYAKWAVVAAFGDALPGVGKALGRDLDLESDVVEVLAALGRYLNYNAYGEDVADLFYEPQVLAEAMLPHEDPLDFISRSSVFNVLADGYRDDLGAARAVLPDREMPGAKMFVLPAEAWARRVSGVFANELVSLDSELALAILTPLRAGGFVVSVRAPMGGRLGADDFCRLFETGGGRRLAAGINYLPESDIDRFAARFTATFAR